MSKQEFKRPIRVGWTSYTLGFRVAGINHRMSNVKYSFEKNKYPRADLQMDRDNEHDRNAIEVLILKNTKFFNWFQWDTKFHIGYIPKELAATMNKFKLMDVVEPRLKSIYRDDNGKITSVIIEIIGPIDFHTDKVKKALNNCEY